MTTPYTLIQNVMHQPEPPYCKSGRIGFSVR